MIYKLYKYRTGHYRVFRKIYGSEFICMYITTNRWRTRQNHKIRYHWPLRICTKFHSYQAAVSYINKKGEPPVPRKSFRKTFHITKYKA